MYKKKFNSYIEDCIRKNWDLPALSDYHGETNCYRDIAKHIAKLHILFEQCGIKQGDKISLAGRNSSNWAISFLATLTYGAVAVPILHEFKPDNVHNIINHSESKFLFVGDVVWEGLSADELQNVNAIVQINDFSFLHVKKTSATELNNTVNDIFSRKYKNGVAPDDVKYHIDASEELAMINYTSGTTGFSKGVMLPYGSLVANLEYACTVLPQLKGGGVVSMLPMAHMYGLIFEIVFTLVSGCHIHFLTRMPTPKIILEAYSSVKPRLIISVPLIVEKIFKRKIKPLLEKPTMRFLMKVPVVKQNIKKKIMKSINNSFGDNVLVVVIGGAAFNSEAEKFFKEIGFQYTVGYGMTECGPLISYDDWTTTHIYSCGKPIPCIQLKIDSPNPETGIGEIIVKGENVFSGYYKNQAATDAAFDADGWFHTGDLGILDSDGYLYIKGRSKNMILGPSGQNIYPEEIEDRLNNLSYINESIVINSNGKLVALIYPDYELAYSENLTDGDLEKILENEKNELNKKLPGYSQISKIKLYPEEFEKTPKKSIKRFLYER
ncbi:MAG: AMP-binding protein [Prevotellaceae bacterium]|jgi:long-chain acyl-CoA synthetase|nr:AMP-binding protein [Prevotellaceae bacterium]